MKHPIVAHPLFVALALAGIGSIAPVPGTAPAGAATCDADREAARRARLIDLALPEGASRVFQEERLAAIASELSERAKRTIGSDGGALHEVEALFWSGPAVAGGRGEALRARWAERVRAAGYRCDILQEDRRPKQTTTLFRLEHPGTKRTLFGCWTAYDAFLTLFWGAIGEAGTAPRPTPADDPFPAALAGAWGFRTASATIYVDRTTGLYQGSGIGGSQAITFGRDGSYRLFSYVKQDAGFGSRGTITNERGAVEFHADSLVFRPTWGEYRMAYGSKSVHSRDMRPEEFKPRKWFWRRATGSQGEPLLQMGANPSELAEYRRLEGDAR